MSLSPIKLFTLALTLSLSVVPTLARSSPGSRGISSFSIVDERAEIPHLRVGVVVTPSKRDDNSTMSMATTTMAGVNATMMNGTIMAYDGMNGTMINGTLLLTNGTIIQDPECEDEAGDVDDDDDEDCDDEDTSGEGDDEDCDDDDDSTDSTDDDSCEEESSSLGSTPTVSLNAQSGTTSTTKVATTASVTSSFVAANHAAVTATSSTVNIAGVSAVPTSAASVVIGSDTVSFHPHLYLPPPIPSMIIIF